MKYEYGDNLKDIAIEYKVPLITINKRKKKSDLKGDPWIKGFRSKIRYQEIIEDGEEQKEIIYQKITSHARNELLVLDGILEDFYNNSSVISIPSIEKAYMLRTERIKRQLEIRMQVERIYPEEKKLSIDLLKQNIALKKVEAELKATEVATKDIDLKIKKQVSDYYLKEKRDE